MPFKVLSDLDPAARLGLLERGLAFGDGLFETMLLYRGSIHYWPQHFSRLAQSAKRLAIECPDREWLEQQLQPYLSLSGFRVIKLTLTRGEGSRGLQIPRDLEPTIIISQSEYDSASLNQPLRTSFLMEYLPENPRLAGIKHLNRLDYVLATLKLRELGDSDEALLSDLQGNVIEGIVHNLFFVLDNDVCTPSIDRCGVDGIMRRSILEHLQQEHKKVNIGDFSQRDILAASECFLCNSVQGICPVIRIEQRELEIGPVTRQLQKVFDIAQPD